MFLKTYHGISISIRTLKRRLKSLCLKKRESSASEAVVRQIIEQEIEGPFSLKGYRTMWNTLRTRYGIRMQRDTVMRILREIDPQASKSRQSRRLRRRKYISPGPNTCWHVDGYDKLKPYGLPIHGCVDGFSRKILWLKVTRSNNNPIIPAHFFLQTINEYQFLPRFVQTDCGSENGIMAGIQSKLRNDINAHVIPSHDPHLNRDILLVRLRDLGVFVDVVVEAVAASGPDRFLQK